MNPTGHRGAVVAMGLTSRTQAISRGWRLQTMLKAWTKTSIRLFGRNFRRGERAYVVFWVISTGEGEVRAPMMLEKIQ